MKTKQSKLAAVTGIIFRFLAICIPVLFLNAAAAQQIPGHQGHIDFKPPDWKAGTTSYWYDTDGVSPGVPGCHVGVKGPNDRTPNGRVFGEACQSAQVLIESNPGANVIHPHENDIGHPDLFNCNAWCIGAMKAKGGVCRPVSGPAPCATSAKCECQ